jgi:hypothetical protein
VVHINQRRDTAANWTLANPVLQLGEVGVETDTLKTKAGNGVSVWTALAYMTTGGSGGGSTITAAPHPTFAGVSVLTIGASTGGGGTTTVIPLEPTWSSGTLTIPEVTGVQYKRNGTNISAGTSSDSTTDITITCVALTGYDLASGYATSWVLHVGPPVITAFVPTGTGSYSRNVADGAVATSVTATGTGLTYQWGWVPAGTLNANLGSAFVPATGVTGSSTTVTGNGDHPAIGGVATIMADIGTNYEYATDFFANCPRVLCKVTNSAGSAYGPDHAGELQGAEGTYPPATGSIGTCIIDWSP